MKRKAPDAVIFDLDGTLVDSIGIYLQILGTAFETLGLPRAAKETVAEAARSADFDWDKVLPELDGTKKAAMIADVRQAIAGIYPGMLRKHLRLIPGTASTLEALSGRGIQVAIVTSTPAEAMPYKLRPLKEAGVENLFSAVITADDVHFKKPHAEPLIACAKKLRADANRSVYVGDSCVDIRAGKAAGMRTIGVLTGFDDRKTLEGEGADAVLKSIRELPDTLFDGLRF